MMISYHLPFVGFALGANGHTDKAVKSLLNEVMAVLESFDIQTLPRLQQAFLLTDFQECLSVMSSDAQAMVHWMASEHVAEKMVLQSHYNGSSEQVPLSLTFNSTAMPHSQIDNFTWSLGAITDLQSKAVAFYEFCTETMPVSLLRKMTPSIGVSFLSVST